MIRMRKGIEVWRPGVNVQTKNPDAQGRITAFEWNHFQKCLVVVAGMSNGKTHQLKAYMAKENPKRVLIVTSRIQLAHTMKANFPQFELYKDNINADWLICQYESLHRIRASEPFDIVISDEIRSTCSNITSVKTNHRFLQDNALAMQSYMQNAQKTILLDADAEVDGMVSDVLHGIFQPHQIRVERYQHCKMKRTYDILELADWWQEFEEDAKAGLKLGVPCTRTKKHAQTVADKCREWGLNTKVYTSLEDDEVMKDFLDVDASWRDADVVIFSSKATVGADCQLKFDRIYMHADARGGCTAREMNQMQGRFRCLTDSTIRLVVAGGLPDSYKSYQECLDFYDERRKTVKDVISGYIRFYPAFASYGQVWAPDHVTSAFAHTRSETSKNFKSDLLQMAVDKGYEVRSRQTTKKKKEIIRAEREIAEHQEFVISTLEGQTEQMYQSLTKSYIDAVEEADTRIKKQEGTQRDRLICEMNAILKHYNGEAPDDYKVYRTMKDYREQIKNVAAVENRRSHAYLTADDLKRLEACPWAAVGSFEPFAQIYHELSSITKILGCESIFDEQHQISKDTLSRHKDDIKKICKRISLLRGEKWIEPTGANDAAMVKSIVSKQMRAVFAVHLVRQRVRLPGSRTKVAMYVIKKDEVVHDLARKSDYYKQYCDGEPEFAQPDIQDLQ